LKFKANEFGIVPATQKDLLAYAKSSIDMTAAETITESHVSIYWDRIMKVKGVMESKPVLIAVSEYRYPNGRLSADTCTKRWDAPEERLADVLSAIWPPMPPKYHIAWLEVFNEEFSISIESVVNWFYNLWLEEHRRDRTYFVDGFPAEGVRLSDKKLESQVLWAIKKNGKVSSDGRWAEVKARCRLELWAPSSKAVGLGDRVAEHFGHINARALQLKARKAANRRNT